MMSEESFDGIVSGGAIADQMLEGVPHCLRARLAVDTLSSFLPLDKLNAIEELLEDYLEEAYEVEQEFDWDAI